MRKSPKFSREVIERAVCMVLTPSTSTHRRGRRDSGARPGPSTTEQQRIKEFEREVRELRKTNETLKLASAYFAQAELDRELRK